MRLSARWACVAVFVLAVALGVRAAQDDAVPQRPEPARLVNDLAGVLGDTKAMEDSLEEFARRTSNQIVVVTVKDLGGYDPTMLAYEIGQRWGVGGKKHNNGVVVLVKPKNDTRGTATVAPGYGLEGALPDALCRRVVEREMIPHFKDNDYDGGVWAALKVIMPIAAGEYSEQQYMDSDGDELAAALAGLALAVGFFIVIILIFRKSGGSNGNSSTFGGGGPIIFPPMGGGGSSFGGGGGSSGFGGFGGFGGGSFGGGGASGSW